MVTGSSPVAVVSALPAGLTEVSVEPLVDAVEVPRALPGSSVESTKIGSALCPSDDLDMTLGALARQLHSSSTVVPRGGEGYPLPLINAEPGREKDQGTSGGPGVGFQKSSPRFSGFLSGSARAEGSQESSPVPKRGKYIVWLHYLFAVLFLWL